MKQMRLKTFCGLYDMPRTTVLDLIFSEGLPAFKIGGRWYIDCDDYIKWRKNKKQS